MIDPRELQGVDLRTFAVRITRQQFRELDADFILTPVLDGPVLVFNAEGKGRASVFSAEIDEWRERLPKAHSPEARTRIFHAVRKAHLGRVELAIGYTWPGNPPGYIEFAADSASRNPGGTGLEQSPSDCGDGRGDSGLTPGGAGDRRVPGNPIPDHS